MPLTLEAGASRTIRVQLAWYVRLSQPARRQGSGGAAATTRLLPAPGTPGASPASTRSSPTGAPRTTTGARGRCASATASTTRRSRRRWWRRSRPTWPSSRRRPCCARRTAGCGRGRAAATPRAAATGPAPTCGTTRRRCRTCSRRSSGRCARPSSTSSQDETGHQTFRTPLPIRAADARRPGRGRRPARRHPQGPPRLAHQRRHRLAARAVAARAREPRLLHGDLGPARQGRARGAAPQHLRHRVLGPGRHVHQLLPRGAGRGGGDGRGAGRRTSRAIAIGWPRACARRRRTCSTASTSSRRCSGRAARRQPDRRRRAWSASYSPEAIAPAREGRAEVPVRRRLPLRRRARRLDGGGVRRRPVLDRAKVEQPPRGRAPAQLPADLSDAREPAAPDVRRRQGRRAAAVHVAARRQALAAVRLPRRGVDRHRVPGRRRT